MQASGLDLEIITGQLQEAMSSRKAAKKRPAAYLHDAAQSGEVGGASAAAGVAQCKRRGRPPIKAKEEKRSPLHVYMECMASCSCQLALALA